MLKFAITALARVAGCDYFMIDEFHVAIVGPDWLEVVDAIIA